MWIVPRGSKGLTRQSGQPGVQQIHWTLKPSQPAWISEEISSRTGWLNHGTWYLVNWKMPELSASSKEPTGGTEWKWWEPPNKNQRSEPARGETHNRNRIPPKRFYLDHRRTTHNNNNDPNFILSMSFDLGLETQHSRRERQDMALVPQVHQ